MSFKIVPTAINGQRLDTLSMSLAWNMATNCHNKGSPELVGLSPVSTPYLVTCTSIGIAEACLLLLADPEWAQIARYLPDSHCFVIKEGVESVGLVAIMPIRPQVMEIMNVAVRPDRQGRGYGQRLVTTALAYAEQHGAVAVEVSTGDSSLGALALYKRCGFVINAIDKDYFLRHYSAPIYEGDRQCRSRITLSWVALGYQHGLGR